MAEIGPVDLAIPPCRVRLARPPISRLFDDYRGGPARRPSNQRLLASTVVRLTFDDAGAVTNRELVANIGSAEFAAAASRFAETFHLERLRDSPEHCRIPQSLLVPIAAVL